MTINNLLKISLLKPVLLLLMVAFLFILPALKSEAATMSVSPGTGVYTSGTTFTVRVVVNTEGKPINAAEGTVTFNPAELSVVSVVKGSIFNLWTVEPSFSNSAGTITFGGGSPSGYTGSAGSILSVTFRAKGSGVSKVGLTKGSVLAADGLGTNVLRSQSGGSYTLSAAVSTPEPEVIVEYIAPVNTPAAPKISSPTHPDETSWYKSNTAEVAWPVPDGVTAVRTLLDESPRSIPTKVYDTAITELSLSDLPEGENYLHIQLKNSDGWGQVGHYRLAVDSKNPTKFNITQTDSTDLYNPSPELRFEVGDETSSVKRFLITVDGQDPYEFIDEHGSSTHVLPVLLPGTHNVVVEAFDSAGNSIVSSYSFAIKAFGKPVFVDYPSNLNDLTIPVIRGNAKPNSTINITEVLLGSYDESGTKQHQVVADGDGTFTFIPEKPFSIGVYEFTARATDESGALSELSDPIRIKVEQVGIIRIAGLAVTVLSVVIPLLALCFLLVVLGIFSHRHIKRVLKIAGRETKEAEMVLEREFSAMELAIKDEEDSLTSSRKSGKLTKSEQQLFAIISENLSSSKKRIMKELIDIDDSLK